MTMKYIQQRLHTAAAKASVVFWCHKPSEDCQEVSPPSPLSLNTNILFKEHSFYSTYNFKILLFLGQVLVSSFKRSLHELHNQTCFYHALKWITGWIWGRYETLAILPETRRFHPFPPLQHLCYRRPCVLVISLLGYSHSDSPFSAKTPGIGWALTMLLPAYRPVGPALCF